jgi:hypothetical protein
MHAPALEPSQAELERAGADDDDQVMSRPQRRPGPKPLRPPRPQLCKPRPAHVPSFISATATK